MTDRERLIELLKNALSAYGKEVNADCKPENFIADFILANGVIVPPVEIGQTVWFIRKDYKVEIIETAVEKVILKHGGLYIKLCCNSMYETTCNSIGKTVFLTKEQAEQALKEREQHA